MERLEPRCGRACLAERLPIQACGRRGVSGTDRFVEGGSVLLIRSFRRQLNCQTQGKPGKIQSSGLQEGQKARLTVQLSRSNSSRPRQAA
jgi:hypothetical protein